MRNHHSCFPQQCGGTQAFDYFIPPFFFANYLNTNTSGSVFLFTDKHKFNFGTPKNIKLILNINTLYGCFEKARKTEKHFGKIIELSKKDIFRYKNRMKFLFSRS